MTPGPGERGNFEIYGHPLCRLVVSAATTPDPRMLVFSSGPGLSRQAALRPEEVARKGFGVSIAVIRFLDRPW